MLVWILLTLVLCYRMSTRVSPPLAPSAAIGAYNCDAYFHSSWAGIRDIWQVPIEGGGSKYLATLDCYRRDRYEYNVAVQVEFPLDACPHTAGSEAMRATRLLMDEKCRGDKLMALLKEKDIVTLPGGYPLLLDGKRILDSIDVGPDGTLSVSNRGAVSRDPTAWLFADPTPYLYVAWREKSPEGALLFDPVFLALRWDRPPVRPEGSKKLSKTKTVVGDVVAELSMHQYSVGNGYDNRYSKNNEFGSWRTTREVSARLVADEETGASSDQKYPVRYRSGPSHSSRENAAGAAPRLDDMPYAKMAGSFDE